MAELEATKRLKKAMDALDVLVDKFTNGDIDRQTYFDQLAAHNATIQYCNGLIKTHALDVKKTSQVIEMRKMTHKPLLGPEEPPALPDAASIDPEDEPIFCSVQQHMVSRSECLDLAEEEKNQDICLNCAYCKETRHILLG